MLKTASTNIAQMLAVVTSLALVGCVDAREAYDDFGSRVVDANNTQIDGEVVSVLPNVDGEWLLAVRPNLPEDKIILFRTTIELTPVTENTGRIDLSAQPLAVADRSPVGAALLAMNQDVASDASFESPLTGLLPGAANPVIPGSNAAINATMHAQLRSADFLCGTLSGTAGSLGLEGTTWGAVRITGDTLPEMIVRCDDEPQ
jgi:hypothetical protein